MTRRIGRSGGTGNDAPRPADAATPALGLLVTGACLLLFAVAATVRASMLPTSEPQADVERRHVGQEPDTLPSDVPVPVRLRPVAGLAQASTPPRPTTIRIPALQVDRALLPLAVDAGSLQVPEDYADVGWWSDGPRPGQPGAAVAVGHLDTPTGPAVFYGLSGLARGDRVVVVRDDDSHAVFSVHEVRLYDHGSFPSDRVYRAEGRPGLNLLTCGGRFDRGSDRYTGNVVVFTDLVRVWRPQAEPATAQPTTQPQRTVPRDQPEMRRLEGLAR